MLDYVISNGSIVDGTGNPWFRADVGIRDGRIVQIGRLASEEVGERIQADGWIVAPGFIDIHAHSDLTLLENPLGESKIRQGVTTETVGHCGMSPAPVTEQSRDPLRAMLTFIGADVAWDWRRVGDYLDRIERNGIALNVAPFVGHVAIRAAAMGFEDRAPTDAELKRMQTLIAEAFEDGVWGLSAGLIFPPSSYATTEELVALCRTVAEQGGLYVPHIRSEEDHLLEATEEAIEIGRRSDVSVEIVHHKAVSERNWGKVRRSVQMMQEARAEGVDVTFDVYPYLAGSCHLSAVLPAWVHDGGPEVVLRRLSTPKDRQRIKAELQDVWTLAKQERVSIPYVGSERNKRFEGKGIREIAETLGKDAVDAIMDLVLEEKNQVGLLSFNSCDEDVDFLLSHPLGMIGSDGLAIAPYGRLGQGKPHPRYYGAYPRILGHYVRERGVLPLEAAIRKMTSMPAQRLGIRDRGLVREGMWADLCLFDPKTVIDRATYEDPHQYPEGIEYVFVNGRKVVERGEHTKALAGKVLRKEP